MASKVLLTLCLLLGLFNPLFAQETSMETQLEKATFAGGCFWCMQPFLDRLKGVKKVTVGYTGGHTKNPTYEEVSTDTTGHAEAVEVLFDPREVSYERIINLFWRNIDPTQVDGQFHDEGRHYRTAIFYHSPEQQQIAIKTKDEVAASGRFDKPIVTEIVPASEFYPAEEYHQSYYKKNPLHYKMYSVGSGRHDFIEKVWGKEEH